MTTAAAKKLTVAQVADALFVDAVSCRGGVFTVRRSFYYPNGKTAEDLAAHVLAKFPSVTVLDQGEVWKPFKGGASVANGSHWFVKFTA